MSIMNIVDASPISRWRVSSSPEQPWPSANSHPLIPLSMFSVPHRQTKATVRFPRDLLKRAVVKLMRFVCVEIRFPV